MRAILPLLFSLLSAVSIVSVSDTPGLPIITVADSINPGTGDFIIHSIQEAEKKGAPALILQIDTPGGLLSTTRLIVQQMLNAKIPVIVYVGPKGAHAGSAGALIALAADVAVMAPGTNIGAAHPVSAGNEKIDETMAKKLANDVAAFAESLAKAKGRNTQWAIKAVRDSTSVTADEALKEGVIDFIASDRSELFTKLPGYKLKVAKGAITALPASLPEAKEVDMSIRHRIVSFFADPNLAYLILTLGGICLWIELSHPGLILPGVVGGLCIIISLVAFQTLPISYGALALIFLGLALIIAELFVPSFGALGIGGIVAFVLGSLFLMDTDVPEFQLSLAIILPTAGALVLAAMGIGYLVLDSRRAKQRSGVEALVGEAADVRERVDKDSGKVFLQGELWNAIAADGAEITVGTTAVVVEVRGMLLVVRRQA